MKSLAGLLALSVATIVAPGALAASMTPDDRRVDCNLNGVSDAVDIANGTSQDCNANGIPDECDTSVSFTTHVIDDQSLGARSVQAGDVDGDGDNDVVAAAMVGGEFAWYPNADGEGSFGPKNVVDASVDAPRDVFLDDLDGDGDLDLLVGADSSVAWYENLTGTGSFGPVRVIDPYALVWITVFASDLDGDGDRDALAGSIGEYLSWWENTDGAGSFVLVEDLDQYWPYPSVSAADMDNDGDSDVVVARFDGIVWLENLDGLGSFGSVQEISGYECCGYHVLSMADVDGDGDDDVLVSLVDEFERRDPEEIAWYENIHSASGFAPKSTISSDVHEPRYALGADLDGDGDIDAVSASSDDKKIAWYENTDGAGSFGAQRIISTSADGAWALHAADVDGDGDQDVLAAAETANEIAWYENESDDCNGNAVPDSCEPDCDGNGVVDACDIRSGASRDCDADGVPDHCQAACPTCDVDGDGCLDEVDSHPLLPLRCADTDLDGCDDCSGGTYDPSGDGPNSDSDGVCDVTDCDPRDNEVWDEPASIATLKLARSGATAHLGWQPPEERGAVHLWYDTLRSTVASDFVDAALCLETDETDTAGQDGENPDAGSVFFYLVRVENGCPGGNGAMGCGSDGLPRTGRACDP